jgi:4-carboxymuconolactone decarboxylase
MLRHDANDFGTFGRFVETPVDQMGDATRKAYGRTLQLRGLVPGSHKIRRANPKLLESIVTVGAYFQMLPVVITHG